jgi:hypothetical protein
MCRVCCKIFLFVLNGCQLLSATPRNILATWRSDLNDTLAKWMERTANPAEHRMPRKEGLHDLVRRFVATYMREAKPDDPGIEPEERVDLLKGTREKWAVIRAAEYYRRDERTIREIIHPSRRTRCRS